MKSNKAIILPETLKIIIAVICIVLLVYLGVSLYSIFTKGHEQQQAKADLNNLMSKIDYASKNPNSKIDYIFESPESWYLVYYDPQVLGGDSKRAMPISCEGKNCLCLCNYNFYSSYYSDYSKNLNDRYIFYDKSIMSVACEKQGFCKSYDSKLEIKNQMIYNREIPKAWYIKIIGFGDGSALTSGYFIDNFPFIYLKDLPLSVKIVNEKSVISIIKKSNLETPILDNLFQEKVTFNGVTNNFFDEVKTLWGNNCKGKLDDNYKSVLQNKIKEFYNSNSYYLGIYYVSKDGLINNAEISYPARSSTDMARKQGFINKEIKLICSGDFSIYAAVES